MSDDFEWVDCRNDDCDNQVKSTKLPFRDNPISTRLCDECIEAQKREKERRARKQRRRQLDDRLRQTGVPKKWAINPTDPPEAMARFVRADFPRMENGLYICGERGAGKTYAACGMIREWLRSEFVEDGRESAGAMFVSLPQLIEGSFNGSDRLLAAADAEFLVIDDVGAESSNDWVDEKVYTLFDAREKSAMPTVMTSNVEPKELRGHDAYDGRVVRRILSMCGGARQVTDYHEQGGLYS
jgi:DNA replication protein DnaC